MRTFNLEYKPYTGWYGPHSVHSLLLPFKEHKSQHSRDNLIVAENNKTL